MWELCSGSATVAAVFKECGWEVWTLDIEPSCRPDHVGNLMNYTYEELCDLSGFEPDFIWFSPPCQTFSIANLHSGHFEKRGNLSVPVTTEGREACRFVLHGLDIIRASNSAYSVVENPRGLLRKQSMMKQFPRCTVTYCQYGMSCMKPTDLWGFFPYSWTPRACKAGDDCHDASPRGAGLGLASIRTAQDRAKVPRDLAYSLAFAATKDFPMRSGILSERWV